MAELPRALLVGANRLFRESLAHSLGAGQRVEVAGQVGAGGSIADRFQEGDLDLVLVDLSCGANESRRYRKDLERRPTSTQVIVLRLSERNGDFLDWVRVGARGYLSSESAMAEVEAAVDQVLAGQVYCSPRATYTLFDRLHEVSRQRQRHRQVEDLVLSPRELEVLRLVARELTNQEIADHLCLSVHTVKNHVHHILDKMDVDCREAAVREAFNRDWLRERRREASG